MAQKRISIKTSGMHCNSCVMLIEMTLGDMEGVDSVHADLPTGTTDVTYEDDRTNPDAVAGEIRKLGYEAEVKV